MGPTTAGGHLAPTKPPGPSIPWDARGSVTARSGSGLSPAAPAPGCNPTAGTGEGKASSRPAKQGGEQAACIALGCRSQHRGGVGAGRMRPTAGDPAARLKASASPGTRWARGGKQGSVLRPALEVSLLGKDAPCHPHVNQSKAPGAPSWGSPRWWQQDRLSPTLGPWGGTRGICGVQGRCSCSRLRWQEAPAILGELARCGEEVERDGMPAVPGAPTASPFPRQDPSLAHQLRG